MWKDFKAFIMRGNVLDLAVAVVIGAAFGAIVKSLVDDIIMPPIGLALGKVDFSNLFVLLQEGPKAPPPYPSLAAAKTAGAVTLNYGIFLNNIITFLIIALAVFLVVRLASRVYRKPAAALTTKPCPFCATDIPLAAKRCPNCTSALA
jgi:large conductance mechanosensitive channel